MLTEESKRVNNLYPNRIQTRGPIVEAVQDDRRLKQMNGAQVSKCSPNTYDSVADRSGEYFRELTNYLAVAVRIQGKAEVDIRQG